MVRGRLRDMDSNPPQCKNGHCTSPKVPSDKNIEQIIDKAMLLSNKLRKIGENNMS